MPNVALYLAAPVPEIVELINRPAPRSEGRLLISDWTSLVARPLV